MRTLKVTHLLFVDDLKTYASSQTIAHKQLDLITQFTNDIGMWFGVDKCADLYMEKGKKKTIGPELEMNGLQITELDDDKTYKYLGMDENIAHQGSLNKERVIKEYTNRVIKEYTNRVIKEYTNRVIKEYTNRVIKEYTNRVIKEYTNRVIKEYTNRVIKEYTNRVIKEYTNRVIKEYTNRVIKEYTNTVIKEYTNRVRKI